ncbi:MAG TPA: biotin/lipoyl-containing protein [Clostridia bacterium]
MKKFLIKVNGNQYEVEVEEVRDSSASSAPVKTVAKAPAAAAAPVKPAAKQNDSVPAGASVINAPMPGTILKVNVSKGDSVKKGQVLLILEAMKMENEIKAASDGIVESVNVEKGSSVKVGDLLVAIS